MLHPFSLISGSFRLYGVYHLPDRPCPCPVVIMFHGLSGTKVGHHRFLVESARDLTQQGIAVVRFDICGHGDSEGDSTDWSLNQFVNDGQACFDWVCQQPCFDSCRVGLFGRSFGGGIAMLLAPVNAPVVSQRCWQHLSIVRM